MKNSTNTSIIKLLGPVIGVFLVFAGYALLPKTEDIRRHVNEQKISKFLDGFHKAEIIDKKQDLPDVTLVSREGRKVDLKSLINGRVTVINFWATWCAPCLEELPSLAKFQAENPDILIVPISLDLQKKLPDLARIFEGPVLQDLRWFYDQSGTLRKDLNLPVYPATYILDKRGHILYILQGPNNWASPEAADFAESLRTHY